MGRSELLFFVQIQTVIISISYHLLQSRCIFVQGITTGNGVCGGSFVDLPLVYRRTGKQTQDFLYGYSGLLSARGK